MTARLLDGRDVASHLRRDLGHRVERLTDASPEDSPPCLAILRDGASEAAGLYAASLERAARSIGVATRLAVAADEPLEALIERLNVDPGVAGIVIAQPFTNVTAGRRLVELIDPAKDVDGLHPVNLGRLVLGVPAPLPSTPRGIVVLLRRFDVTIAGADVVIVGRGITVGRSLGLLLTRRSENATVTACHTGTKDLAGHTRRADILVAATGSPGLITADMVKPGAAVVDVGITRTTSGLVGDVAPAVAESAGWLSPVPGGVGPMTRAMLLTSVVEAGEKHADGRG
jgi:methylenetetrahydrofolate dehydrogenase (NADP+) / methenyltetrahydrofolate cyclohydrolase